MEPRRKALGRRLARARRKAGYRSQSAFAEAIGVSEGSVANAERGSDRVGDGVFTAIEVGLNLPDEITTKYLQTGDDQLLELITFDPGRRPPSEPKPNTDKEMRERLRERLWELRREGLSREDVMRIVDDVRAELLAARDTPDADGEAAGSNG